MNSRPLLECVNVSKLFHVPRGRSSRDQEPVEQLRVLQSVDLKIESGQTTAIMGRSGGGKSTLLSCIAGLDAPSGGRVLLKGVDLQTLKPDELNRFRAENVGIVFQQYHLIDYLTALENVRLPLDLRNPPTADSDAKAMDALKLVGLDLRADHFPHELSRGECQRVAIARVLVSRPELILADEPTGSLDEATGSQVMDLLFELTAKLSCSLLLVTHDRDLAKRCGRQYRLSEGRLVALE